ncbi:WecB/TagA/CpsF family glycosyltransferase [Demetria terragena]|uniref:WecB/TagA/CpsF family glycosyltransferase n=1 Tax=Demetria terragena TaxID=63959 RepID=UPI000367AAA6|nr:WecB/TagA/CpsF family glycosyltransferase [Demetria terragena]
MSTAATAHVTPGVQVAGVALLDGTVDSLAQHLVGLVHAPGTDVAVGVNAHVINLGQRDASLREFLGTSLNYADGQSVVWAGRFLGGQVTERVATTDLAEPLLREAAAADLRVFFFGSAPGVADRAASRLREQIPGLQIRACDGYPDDMDQVLYQIADHQTAILFVGLGDPLQQQWITRHRADLPSLVLTCGGLFDWLSQSNPRAPHWMIAAGLEWLWRLGLEPRRLGRRYVVGNPAFIATVLKQRWTTTASTWGQR